MNARTSPEPVIFAPRESRTLAQAVGEAAGVQVAELEERDYEGGEFKLRPLQSLRDRAVFVLQTLVETAAAPIALRLVRLLFLLQTLTDAGAGQLTAVIPYLAYARKDRRNKPRDPVYTRYVAELLEATRLDRVVLLDVHNAVAIDNAFRIPTEHLTALPMMAEHFAIGFPAGALAVASPDIGGIKRAQQFCGLLQRRLSREVELLFIEKRRDGPVISGGAIVGDPRGRNVIVLDDLCATGATLMQAASVLRAAGAASVHAAVTHTPVQAGLAALAATDSIAQVVVTDSVGYSILAERRENVRTLPIAPLLGVAIARISRGEPLAPLSEHWPPPGA
jgi:ribose-phosphate pyrophosphokinase